MNANTLFPGRDNYLDSTGFWRTAQAIDNVYRVGAGLEPLSEHAAPQIHVNADERKVAESSYCERTWKIN